MLFAMIQLIIINRQSKRIYFGNQKYLKNRGNPEYQGVTVGWIILFP